MRRTEYFAQAGRLWIAALFVALTLALAGCGARLGPSTTPAAAADELVVDIPTIYIDFDADGNATLGGIPVSQLGAALGSDLSSISMEPTTIERLQKLDIQHIQLATRPSGALIFVNGKPAPAFVWNEESLAALVATLDAMGQDLGAAGGILPLLPKLGLNIGLRFPVTAGKSEIPLTVSNAPFDNVAKTDLAAVVAQQPTIPLEINYAADGTFELGGINPLMAGMIQGPLAAAATGAGSDRERPGTGPGKPGHPHRAERTAHLRQWPAAALFAVWPAGRALQLDGSGRRHGRRQRRTGARDAQTDPATDLAHAAAIRHRCDGELPDVGAARPKQSAIL